MTKKKRKKKAVTYTKDSCPKGYRDVATVCRLRELLDCGCRGCTYNGSTCNKALTVIESITEGKPSKPCELYTLSHKIKEGKKIND